MSDFRPNRPTWAYYKWPKMKSNLLQTLPFHPVGKGFWKPWKKTFLFLAPDQWNSLSTLIWCQVEFPESLVKIGFNFGSFLLCPSGVIWAKIAHHEKLTFSFAIFPKLCKSHILHYIDLSSEFHWSGAKHKKVFSQGFEKPFAIILLTTPLCKCLNGKGFWKPSILFSSFFVLAS